MEAGAIPKEKLAGGNVLPPVDGGCETHPVRTLTSKRQDKMRSLFKAGSFIAVCVSIRRCFLLECEVTNFARRHKSAFTLAISKLEL